MRGPQPWLLLLVLPLGGCTRASPTPSAAASQPPTSSGGNAAARPNDTEEPRYVLLFEGGLVASGLDATADTARAVDTRPDHSSDVYWVFRLRARYGEWLEVQTVDGAEADRHCHPARLGLEDFDLRLYVRTREVSAVTTREVMVPLDNGNQVTVGPGVRVTLPQAEGEPAVVHGARDLPLMLPADVIGVDYPTPRYYDQGDVVASVRAPALRLTDRVVLPEYLGANVFARREDGDRTIVTLAEGCLSYDVSVPTALVTEPEAWGVGGLGMVGGRNRRYEIAPQAPIYWPNGERAGATRRAVIRFDEPARREVGRMCFDHVLAWSRAAADATLTLCFDDTDVRSLEPESSAEPAVDRPGAAAPG